MATELAAKWARLMRVVAHPTRLMILMELSSGMKCVNDIQELLDVPQPNVSQHLAVLKRNGLVVSHKDGRRRCCYLAKPAFIRDLLAVLGGDYPAAEVGDPGAPRAAGKTRGSSEKPPGRKRAT